MKIRIKGNSLRLRLSQSEIETFASDGRVADQISFGPDLSECLEYELVRSARHHSMMAEFSGAEISVYMPEELANNWTSSELVGASDVQETGQDTLSILVEKDFQCMQPRPGENESDLYPNPAANTAKPTNPTNQENTPVENQAMEQE